MPWPVQVLQALCLMASACRVMHLRSACQPTLQWSALATLLCMVVAAACERFAAAGAPRLVVRISSPHPCRQLDESKYAAAMIVAYRAAVCAVQVCR